MKPKFDFVRTRLSEIRKANLYRQLYSNRVSGPYIWIEKRKLVNLSSNDYLALGKSFPQKMQVQSSSRLVAGNDLLFERLESKIAQHKQQDGSLIFPTGYMANMGAISVLSNKGDMIFSDELNHASIIDSCKLCSSRKIVYKHNDIEDLRKKLRVGNQNKFVITEGVFSMNGDLAKLKEIASLCQRCNAILILDDAHGDFVLGRDGRGTAEYFGVNKKVDIYISSLSKGLGAFGGYVASKKSVLELLVNRSRPFIYTSALPNFMVQMALDKLRSQREARRKKLWKNVKAFHKGLDSLGYKISSQSHIIPVIIGDEKKAMNFGKFLRKNGVFAQPIRYPTVRLGSARIRISVTAWLTDNIITESLDLFEKAGKRFGIL